MIRYNVLWIDDEYKTQEDFISLAEQYKIDITPCESHEEGMEILFSKTINFNAVILDAKVKNQKSDTTTGVKGLAASRDRLIEHNKEEFLPFFIFTGQPDYMKDDMFRDSYGKFFIKGDDTVNLLETIIEECKNSFEIQSRKRYSESFEVFDINILNNNSKNLLLDILKNVEQNNFEKKNINTQRDLLEAIFKALNQSIPCIPSSFFDATKNYKPNLEWCVRYLEDREINGEKLNKEVPKPIKSAFRKLKESTNEFSHLKEDDIVKMPFLANTFLLLEILEWMPKFCNEHYKNYF